jgi:DNA-binding XRE family transcriptional regulator
LRRRSGRTQAELAHDCGVAENTLVKAEGGGPIDVTTAGIIARHLGVGCEAILAGSPDGPGPAGPAGGAWRLLVGRWVGRIEQSSGPDGCPFTGEVRMEFAGPTSGRYVFTIGGTTIECPVEVTWLVERFFRWDADPPEPGGFLCNTGYFQVNPAGDRISGRYVGIGPHTGGVVAGEVTGRREVVGPAAE